MVQARAARPGQGGQVVVAVVRAVEEGDDVARGVGDAQTEHLDVKARGPDHVRAEHQQVREIQRPDLLHLAARGRAAEVGAVLRLRLR